MAKEPNEKQIAFIEEYLKGKTRYEAAILAGYKEGDSAYVQGCRLLKNPVVIKYMEERKEELKLVLNHKFIEDAVQAREVMKQIMNDPEASHRDRLTASKDFMDRAGFKAKEEIKLKVEPVINVTRKKVEVDTIESD